VVVLLSVSISASKYLKNRRRNKKLAVSNDGDASLRIDSDMRRKYSLNFISHYRTEFRLIARRGDKLELTTYRWTNWRVLRFNSLVSFAFPIFLRQVRNSRKSSTNGFINDRKRFPRRAALIVSRWKIKACTERKKERKREHFFISSFSDIDIIDACCQYFSSRERRYFFLSNEQKIAMRLCSKIF